MITHHSFEWQEMSDRSCNISRLFNPERATAKSSQPQLGITPGRARQGVKSIMKTTELDTH